MRDWGKIKRVRRFGYLLLLINVILGIVLSINSINRRQQQLSATQGAIGYIIAKRGVNLRQLADASSVSITTIAVGEPVTILTDSSKTDKGWVKVNYNGNEGWIWGSYIKR